jgi:hypothetical protein
MNKEEKLAKWGRIVTSMKPPPLYEKWTNGDEVKLEEAQLDIIEMAHTALGHMVALKKKELCWLRVRCHRRTLINWWRQEVRRRRHRGWGGGWNHWGTRWRNE